MSVSSTDLNSLYYSLLSKVNSSSSSSSGKDDSGSSGIGTDNEFSTLLKTLTDSSSTDLSSLLNSANGSDNSSSTADLLSILSGTDTSGSSSSITDLLSLLSGSKSSNTNQLLELLLDKNSGSSYASGDIAQMITAQSALNSLSSSDNSDSSSSSSSDDSDNMFSMSSDYAKDLLNQYLLQAYYSLSNSQVEKAASTADTATNTKSDSSASDKVSAVTSSGN